MTFLIDLENVSNVGFEGIENLTAHDKLLIFYPEISATISMSTHRKLDETPALKEYFPIKTGGKNALDFQLVTYLGYLIAQNNGEKYCIVSKDEGFNFAIHFWKKSNLNILRSPTLAIDASRVQKNIGDEVKKLLPDHSQDWAQITHILTTSKTKQDVNNLLVKSFGSQNAGIIYKEMRSLILGKPGK